MSVNLQFIRSLSPAMAKVLLVFLFERGGMTIDELISRTGINDRHVLSRACRDLADPAYGILVSQVGAHGRVTWLPAGNLLPELRQQYFANPDGRNHAIWIEEQPAPQIQMAGITPSESENSPILPPAGRNHAICAGSIMMTDESIINQSKESSIINPQEKIPPVETLLSAMEILFGDVLDLSEIPNNTPPKLLLAWIVKGYQDKSKLANPLGLIRSRLKAKSPRSLPANWRDRLPGEFLRAIGLAEAARVAIDDQPTPVDEPDEDSQSEPSELEELWENAIEHLDLQRSVRQRAFSADPCDWDASTGEFLVEAETQDDADWLESRLGTLLSRQLSGELNQPVTVIFRARAG